MKTTPSNPCSNLRAALGHRLTVGAHVVDLDTLRVLTAAEQPRLTPKAVSVLLELVGHVGRTVTHTDLLERVWAGTRPTQNSLTQAIKELRRAFGGSDRHGYIETIPKIGYRLTVPARLDEQAERCPVVRGEWPDPDEDRVGSPWVFFRRVLGHRTDSNHGKRIGILIALRLVLLILATASPALGGG